ncbi:MAG TPA: hypothetical protein VGO67_01455 [Verrucomicrobiae bacterium]|jgi:hypothetical protein
MAKTIPLSVPDDLLAEVKETARLTHLSVQDVFRQSVKIAKPSLRQSARVERPKRLSLWDALASGAGLQLCVTAIEGDVEKVKL